ncbi:MAG: methionine--tRNA ligase [Candidatus Hodarchaeota archaeon]
MVTSAWPYVNYVPHLGNLVSSILSADVVARYYRLKGDEVVYVTGSDEHGTPIEVEAVRQGKTPKELTDQNHEKFVNLFEKWGISFTNYTRTESPVHKKFVRELLLTLYNNGYTFTQETDLPYCPQCNRFLPDRFIEGTCPICGHNRARGDQCEACGSLLEPTKLIKPYCTICETQPIVKRSKHWFFDLPRFSEQLLDYIKGNKQLLGNARNFSLKLLQEGLRARPITRDNKWGIRAPFPGAEGKTVYVWVEAVLGYLSATLEYFQQRGEEETWEEYWLNKETKTLFFIGKDNIPFHTLILPSLLLATHKDYNLPWTVNATEFLMFEDQAFSKSRRIGVWIDEALDLFPTDYWRYALISMRPEKRDTNFSWKAFIERVNSDLNDTLGNFIHRTLTFLNQHFHNEIPKPYKLTAYDKHVLKLVRNEVERIAQSLETLKLRQALRQVMGISHIGNRYLNKTEPWKTINIDSPSSANTLYVSSQIVKILAIILEPFTPFTAEKIWEMLNLSGSIHDQRWQETKTDLPSGHEIQLAIPLFSKIKATEAELQTMLEEIRSK